VHLICRYVQHGCDVWLEALGPPPIIDFEIGHHAVTGLQPHDLLNPAHRYSLSNIVLKPDAYSSALKNGQNDAKVSAGGSALARGIVRMHNVAKLQVEIPGHQALHDPCLVDALDCTVVKMNLCLTCGELEQGAHISARALPTVTVLEVHAHAVTCAEADETAG